MVSHILRRKFDGYNQGDTVTLAQLGDQREEFFTKHYNISQQPYEESIKLKLQDPIYRLLHTSDEQMRKFYHKLKAAIEEMGIKIVPYKDQTN